MEDESTIRNSVSSVPPNDTLKTQGEITKTEINGEVDVDKDITRGNESTGVSAKSNTCSSPESTDVKPESPKSGKKDETCSDDSLLDTAAVQSPAEADAIVDIKEENERRSTLESNDEIVGSPPQDGDVKQNAGENTEQPKQMVEPDADRHVFQPNMKQADDPKGKENGIREQPETGDVPDNDKINASSLYEAGPSSNPPEHLIIVKENTLSPEEKDGPAGETSTCEPLTTPQLDDNQLLSPGIFHAYPDDSDTGLLLLNKAVDAEIEKSVGQEADSLCEESIKEADKYRSMSVSPDLGHELMEFGDLRRQSLFPKTKTAPALSLKSLKNYKSQKDDELREKNDNMVEPIPGNEKKESPTAKKTCSFKDAVKRNIAANSVTTANSEKPVKTEKSPTERFKRKVVENSRNVANARRPLNRQVNNNGGKLPNTTRRNTSSSWGSNNRKNANLRANTDVFRTKATAGGYNAARPTVSNQPPPKLYSRAPRSVKTAEVKTRNDKLISSKLPTTPSTRIKRPKGADSKSPPVPHSSKKKRTSLAATGMSRRDTSVDFNWSGGVEEVKGISGTPTEAICNYFAIGTRKKVLTFSYEVIFKYDKRSDLKLDVYDRKNLLFEVNPLLITEAILDLNSRPLTMYSALEMENSTSYNLVYSNKATKKDVPVRICITNKVKIAHTTPEYRKFLELLFSRILTESLTFRKFGNCYFDPRKSVSVSRNRAELLSGYQLSVQGLEGGNFLTVFPQQKLFSSMTVLEYMNYLKYCLSETLGPSISPKSKNIEEEKCIVANLKNQQILTKYNGRIYVILDVDFTRKISDEFDCKGGKMSFTDYYKEKYNVSLAEENQPLIRVKHKSDVEKPIYMVPELCCLCGDYLVWKYNKAPSTFEKEERSTKHEVSERSLRKLEDLMKNAKDFGSKINNNSSASETLRQYGVNLKPQTPIPSRLLPAQVLKIKNDETFKFDRSAKDFGELGGTEFVMNVSPIMDKITIICTEDDRESADYFSSKIIQSAREIGVTVRPSKVKIVPISSCRLQEYQRVIRYNARHLKSRVVICVLPKQKKELLEAIKRYCCFECPTLVQIVLSKHLRGQYYTKEAVKGTVLELAAMSGSELWGVHIPLKNVMYVGISMFVDKGMCCFGLVSSYNDLCTRFYSSSYSYKLDGNSKEGVITSGLDILLEEALQNYRSKNDGSNPSRIMIFKSALESRAPVTVEEIKQVEVPALARTISSIKSTEFIYTVIYRKHKLLFLTKEESNLVKPLSGTTIDDVVTEKGIHDFYLVSQSNADSGLEPASPTYYQVIEFETTLKPDHLQQIAYKLSHLNYSKMEMRPMPCLCEYSARLAKFVANTLDFKKIPASLQNFLFYL